MTSRLILVFALLVPSAVLADLGGAGWDVQPTDFRLDASSLIDEGSERGYVRSPTLSILASGHHPIGIADADDLDETAGGAALRLEIDFPIPVLTFLTIGGYVEGGWRRIWSEWEWENVDFVVVDFGAHARLRFTVGSMQLFAGGHIGMTHLEGHAELTTMHYGGHAGMRAGRRVGVQLLIGMTQRNWRHDPNTFFDESFEQPFPELWGSLGISIVLGDYR